MGIAYQSVKDSLNYCVKTKSFLFLVLALTCFTLLTSLLEVAGIPSIIKWSLNILRIFVSFLFGGLALCLFKEKSLSKAFKLFYRRVVGYIAVNLAVYIILIVFVVAAGSVLYLAFAASNLLPDPLDFVAKAFLFITLLISVVVFIHLSLRISLADAVLILKGTGVGESIRKSWTVSKGKVVPIFAAGLMLGFLYFVVLIILLIPFGIGYLLVKNMAAPSLLSAGVLIVGLIVFSVLFSLLQNFYMLSNAILTMVLLQKFLKKS